MGISLSLKAREAQCLQYGIFLREMGLDIQTLPLSRLHT
jgi:hypothetical protein